MNGQTIAAMIRFFIPCVAGALTYIGVDLDVNLAYTVCMGVVTFGTLIYCWFWRNNNFTKAAQIAQGVKDSIKDESIVDFKEIIEAVENDEPGGE